MHRYCGCTTDLTVDHITPVSKGGLWEWSNLVTACNTCNGRKGSKTLKQLGWKLKKMPTVCSFLLLLHKHCMYIKEAHLPCATSSQHAKYTAGVHRVVDLTPACNVQAPSSWQVGILVGPEVNVKCTPKVCSLPNNHAMADTDPWYSTTKFDKKLAMLATVLQCLPC